tara:strand:- start:176 stop:865 length:690 start_codon:yes stop_codon:yes gene_type:complete
MNLCIIPARGGSKRIKRKNIREFCGKPIIAWSIQAAKKSNCFEKVVVSTDDNEIADIAKSFGAEIPFSRPKDLSDDFTTTSLVVEHCIDWFCKNSWTPNLTCCLYATAPFVTSSNIAQAFEIFKFQNVQRFIFSATSYPFPIQRAFRINKDGNAEMFDAVNFKVRSQDLEIAYHDAAQFYIGKTNTWLKNNNLFEGSKPYVLPKWQVQDIDNEEDWARAELMFKILNIN